MSPQALESAVLIPVPEAEPLVGDLRSEHDPSAAVGVPAHVTLLYPFLAPDEIDGSTVEALGDVFATTARFRFALWVARWFEDGLLFLEPDPAEPFVRLTRRLVRRFPQYPPYAGTVALDELVPHLTVAMRGTEELERLLSPALPIESVAAEAHLMQSDPSGRWSIRERFPLGERA